MHMNQHCAVSSLNDNNGIYTFRVQTALYVVNGLPGFMACNFFPFSEMSNSSNFEIFEMRMQWEIKGSMQIVQRKEFEVWVLWTEIEFQQKFGQTIGLFASKKSIFLGIFRFFNFLDRISEFSGEEPFGIV